MSDTHINAYYMAVDEAQTKVDLAKGELETAKSRLNEKKQADEPEQPKKEDDKADVSDKKDDKPKETPKTPNSFNHSSHQKR